jgi:hypothetical protein
MGVLSLPGPSRAKSTVHHNAEIYIRPALDNDLKLYALKIMKKHFRTAQSSFCITGFSMAQREKNLCGM